MLHRRAISLSLIFLLIWLPLVAQTPTSSPDIAQGAKILARITESFKEDGFVGVVATRSRNLGGTDSTSFNQAGLPGIGLGQDPIEYGTHTWHTNLDTYERILEDDGKRAAIVVATALYELAMRDEMLPRFTKETMPPPPPEPSPTPATTPARTNRPRRS
jgi:carboxypeptidase Q